LIKGGYVGKILRVNLTEAKLTDQELPDEKTLRQYVGCFGLGLKMAYDEIPLGISPWDPRNIIYFMTGPLTSTHVPLPNNTTAVSLNFLTQYTVGRSHTHGWWGPYLKFAGYDGVIIEGASQEPVYLWICDGRAELRDAKKFWGKDTHEAEDLIKKDLGVEKASVAATGPAGENLVHGAIIANDKHHSFSHSGTGAVLGSKKLKAMAVYGETKEIPLADPERMKKVVVAWMKDLFKSDIAKFMRLSGQSAEGRRDVYDYDKRIGVLSAKNFLERSPPEWLANIEEIAEITPKPCFRCPVGCSYEVKILKGPYKGYVGDPSGGGENMEGPSSMAACVNEVGAIYHMVDLQDRLGMEAGFIGCAVGLAFECYEKGLITKKDTDGLELKWGDVEAAEELMRRTARREGLGDILALGAKRAAEIIGGDAPKFAVHIKGSDMNMHDWRSSWGILFGQIVGGGSGWPSQGATGFSPDPDAGYTELQDPFTPEGKAEAARKTGIKKYFDDSMGTCWFASWGVPGVLKYASDAISAATGWNFTPEEALLVGERVLNLERAFNCRRGLTPEDDFDVGPRVLEPLPSSRDPRVPGTGKTIAPYLKGMVAEYYRLMGWDEKTGKPWRSTLDRLGLQKVADDLWGR